MVNLYINTLDKPVFNMIKIYKFQNFFKNRVDPDLIGHLLMGLAGADPGILEREFIYIKV